jgi:hypothetical protein
MLTPGSTTVGGHGGCVKPHASIEACRSRSRETCAQCADRESGWLSRQPANKLLPNHYEGYASHPSTTTGQTRECTAANVVMSSKPAVLSRSRELAAAATPAPSDSPMSTSGAP